MSAATLWKGSEALEAGINGFLLPDKHWGALEIMKIISIVREKINLKQPELFLVQEIVNNFTSSRCILVCK